MPASIATWRWVSRRLGMACRIQAMNKWLRLHFSPRQHDRR
jgi:hypothetical protein